MKMTKKSTKKVVENKNKWTIFIAFIFQKGK